MKLFLSLLFFLTFFSFQIFAQTIENEIVLASEKFTIDNIQEIKQLLSSKEGLLYKGYCEEHHLLLIQLEVEKFDIKKVIEIVQEVVSPQSILIKEGGFDAVYKVCLDRDKMHLR